MSTHLNKTHTAAQCLGLMHLFVGILGIGYYFDVLPLPDIHCLIFCPHVHQNILSLQADSYGAALGIGRIVGYPDTTRVIAFSDRLRREMEMAELKASEQEVALKRKVVACTRILIQRFKR